MSSLLTLFSTPWLLSLTITGTNESSKVGDTLEAIVEGGSGEYTYAWYANDEAIFGADSATLTVSSDQLGKILSVIVTDSEGNVAESADTAAVTHKDLSVEVTITDVNGLQEDGTALPGDTLHLSYGAALGTPESIIWYKDGAAVKINTARGGFGGAFDTVPANIMITASKARGEWYVVVENTAGENYVSNSIMVTPVDKAVMTGVTITEDYEGPHIEYTKTTSTAVVTVTMNKDYDGTFYLAPNAKTTFYNKQDLKNKIAVKTTTLATITDVPKLKDLTDKAAAGLAAGKGLKYTNEETGEVTYKFPVKMDAAGDAVKRGSDYNLIFDQDDIDEDDLAADSGKGKLEDLDLNMTDDLTVPYVIAPESIAVTNYVRNGTATATIKVGLYDEDGEALTWYKDAASEAATTGIGELPGFGTKIKVYNIENNAAATTDAACTGPSDATADKGVATLTYTGQNKKFAYVTLETTAGVFAADSVTLTTPVVETLGPALDKVEVTQDSANPKDAVIKFTNLTKRGSGTVYLFQSSLQAGAGTGDDGTEATAAVITAQNKEGAWMLGSATVEGGSSSVTIPNVFDKSVIGVTVAGGADKYQDYYAALFVPDDAEYYSDLASDTFQLKHSLKSYALDTTYEKQTVTALGNGLTKAIRGVDQFGDSFELDATSGKSLDAADETAAKKLDSTLTATAGLGEVQATFTTNGTVTVTATYSGTSGAPVADDFVKDTYHEASLPGGQKLVITCDTGNTTATDTATFKLTIK